MQQLSSWLKVHWKEIAALLVAAVPVAILLWPKGRSAAATAGQTAISYIQAPFTYQPDQAAANQGGSTPPAPSSIGSGTNWTTAPDPAFLVGTNGMGSGEAMYLPQAGSTGIVGPTVSLKDPTFVALQRATN
jgi:hypothetical protein